jgi:long-chain acyl-CoA synthetase
MPVTDDRLVSLHPEMTLPEVWNARILATPDREAYRVFEPASRAWVSYTWSGVSRLVERWRRAFFAENFAPGARIGVLLPNGIDHVCADQAALALGLVTVPLHVIDNPGNLAYILADCAASALIVDSLERWRALADHRAELPDLRCVVYLSEPTADEGIAKAAGPWLTGAPDVPAAPDSAALDAAAVASIVYTSGTTGRPKGVMLSHRNIVTNLAAIERAICVHADDVFLSFLPLSHTLERTAGYYLPVAAGAAVAFARSVAHLMEDLRAVRPTVLISVPRIYERAYAALREAVEAHSVKRWILARAIDLGWRRFEYAQHRAPRPFVVARLAWPLLDRVVGAPLRDRFGGRLRAAVAGGAPLPALVARPFLALGVPVLQGYGMTESAPVVSCNTPVDNDPATVGRPLPGVEVRIGEGGELLVHGGNVMMGYWQRPSDTAAALSSDGWLHTGDLAVLEDGRIRISGRIKDIIVTSTGEKVSPADLEAAILDDPMFDQAMVIGEQRPFLAALLVLNPGRWPEAATRLGLDPGDASSAQSRVATQWALERVRQTAKSFPIYAVPRAVVLATDVWTTANGLITPTLKPKRPAIAAHYAAQIDRIYAAHSLPGCAPRDDNHAAAQGRGRG